MLILQAVTVGYTSLFILQKFQKGKNTVYLIFIKNNTVYKLSVTCNQEGKGREKTMSFQFRKSKKIAPGTRLNVGKKSAGISTGVKGARVSVNSKGRATFSANIPGTGIRYRKSVKIGSGIIGTACSVMVDFLYICLLLTWWIIKLTFWLFYMMFYWIYRGIAFVVHKVTELIKNKAEQ